MDLVSSSKAEVKTFLQDCIIAPFLSLIPNVIHDLCSCMDVTLENVGTPNLDNDSKKVTKEDGVCTTRQKRPFSFLADLAAEDEKSNVSSNIDGEVTSLDSLRHTNNNINDTISLSRMSSISSNASSTTDPVSTDRGSVRSLLFHEGNPFKHRIHRSNSLLSEGRNRYVGSHFNKKLTNTASLFREVKVPRRRDIMKTQRVKRRSNTDTPFIRGVSSLQHSGRQVHPLPNNNRNLTTTATMSPVLLRRSSTVVKETPTKEDRKRRKIIISDSPQQPAAKSLVAAAFAKKRKKSHTL